MMYALAQAQATGHLTVDMLRLRALVIFPPFKLSTLVFCQSDRKQTIPGAHSNQTISTVSRNKPKGGEKCGVIFRTYCDLALFNKSSSIF